MKKYLTLLLCSCLLLMGCATKPTNPEELKAYEEANDPIEPFNRGMFATNMLIDKALLNPLAKGYRAITPPFFRTGVKNFYANLKQPIYLLNTTLVGEGKASFNVTKRFMANTLLGLGGLFDVASDMGIPTHDVDFGQTLAVWGWRESNPYIVLPILGPSNPRDALGWTVDASIAGVELIFIDDAIAQYTLAGLDIVRIKEENLNLMENLEKSSSDFYATIRSMYRQNRQKKIDEALQEAGQTATPNYDFNFTVSDE